MVCRLQKSIYGLKKASKQWYKKFNNFMSNNGFLRYQADHYYYVKRFDGFYIILLLYVDDMLITKASIHEINKQNKEIVKGVYNEGFRCCETNPWDEDY